MLDGLGAPLTGSADDRASVYLTNALTGWAAPAPPKPNQTRQFPEMEAERLASDRVKRERHILVVLGNPPYNAFAGVSPQEEDGLVEPYKEGLISEWGIKKFNLDDLYVRFFRLAERRIAEMTGKGVVSFISNHSWISDPSFVVLRKHLLESFDRFWIENLHGNRKVSEYAPDGRTSQTVFAIQGFSPGIQQGVATSLWVKSGRRKRGAEVLFRDDLHAAKAVERRQQLISSLEVSRFDAQYKAAKPAPENRFSFRPSVVASHYLEWPRLVDLCAEPPSNGLMEKRGGALIDIDRSALEKRMRVYFDPQVEWGALETLGTGLTRDAAGFVAKKVRLKVLNQELFSLDRVRGFLVRPFDSRWCYYSAVSPLWNRARPSLWAQCWPGNAFLMSRPAGVAHPEGLPLFFTTLLGDNDALRGHAYYFPVRLKRASTNRIHEEPSLYVAEDPDSPVANLSRLARSYQAVALPGDVDGDGESAAVIWMHALAIGFSPLYLAENADGIRQDWPRIPLPAAGKTLAASASTGRTLASLLDLQAKVPGVDVGRPRPELSVIAVPSKVDGGSLDPQRGELALTAGWGHLGKDGVTMPGKGKAVEREYTKAEAAEIERGARSLGLTATQVFECLGQKTLDVYLNDAAYWSCVPAHVWEFTIGGYQVLKKWFSYREQVILGRALASDEAFDVHAIARRLTALVLLRPALDTNYRACIEETYIWPRAEA